MNKLKFLISFCLVIFAGQKLFGQSLKIGFASVIESSFSNSLVQIDSVAVFEQVQRGDIYLMPFVKAEWPITERLYSSFGVQYYRSYLSLTARYTSESYPEHIPFITKGRSTSTSNLEFPLGLSFLLVKKNQFRVFLELSAVPVWSIQGFTPLDIDVPQGIDWTQEILDVINAVETIPNPFYMNYQYGISMEYKRLGFTLFRAANMNRSISNGYTLYGQDYNFMRRIQSNRLGIYYAFGLKKDKEKSIN